MRKRVTAFILFVAILITVYPADVVKAEEHKELNIYAMYLGEDEKGDSVLLETQGHYLLVDIGAAAHVPAIICQLNALGVTHVDIMISHLHSDHIGAASDSDITAGLNQLRAAGITVDTMYLPAVSLTPLSQIYAYRYQQLQSFMMQQGQGRIIYLNTGDLIQFGDVTGQVIGPIDTWKLSPSQYTQYSTELQRYIAYENNCSLAVIFTCGTTRYFTAGDCYADEAKALVEKYGDTLQCDIMKLSHHGIGSGNSAALLKAVKPKYSFIPNTGITNTNEETGRWRTYTAMQRASKSGMCYMIGNEEKTIIYHIVDDSITLYQGLTVTDDNKMTGWQYLYGADGTNRDHDMYYLNSSCRPVTGVRKIGSHYYRFSAGGQMDYGNFSDDGNYLGWKSYSNGKRYYMLSSNNKYAYMCRGFDTVDGVHMYFDTDGYQIVGDDDDEVELKKIGSDYYAVDFEGEITVNEWEDIDGFMYYFDKNGKMIRNREYKVEGQYYLFDTDGTMYMGNGGTEFYDFGSKTYAVRRDGTLVTGKCGKIDGAKYYFDSKGAMQKNRLIKIGTKKYYFGKNGKMVLNRKFKLNGKTYTSNAKGVVSVVKKK